MKGYMMSTKIYDAYKFDGTFEGIFRYCQQKQKEWVKFQTNRLVDLVECWEANRVTGFSDFSERVKKQTKAEFPTHFDYFDVRGSVWIGSYKGQIYVKTFLDVSHPESNYCKFNFTDDRFRLYEYQNQTDGFENNKTRGKIWDSLLPNGVWSQDGFIYDFSSDYMSIFNITSDAWEKIKSNGIWKPK